MGKRVQAAETVDSQGHHSESGDHPPAWRRPAGRKAGPAPEFEDLGANLLGLLQKCFGRFNRLLALLPDPRQQDLCTYVAAHLWWHIVLSFLLRRGSRNGFDTARNSGCMPANMLRLCGQEWDEQRLGPRRTVSCSENAKRHAGRVSVEAVAELPLYMVERLFEMRMLERARLFGSWWMILIDGTLKDRGHRCKNGNKRYRYVLDAKLLGPNGLTLHLMSEFINMRDPVLEKEDCELNAFRRKRPSGHPVDGSP